MKRPNLGAAALALFDGATQNAIISYCQRNSPAAIAADLDRSNPLLPPGIFALASPRYALDEDNAYYVLLGLSMLYLSSTKDEFGKGTYQTLLTELFGLDPTYAGALADRIETADKQDGWGATIWAHAQQQFNDVKPDWLFPGLEANVGDQSVADIDLGFEMLELGKVVQGLLTRQAMIVNRLDAAAAGSSNPLIQRMLSIMNRAQAAAPQSGDLYDAAQQAEAFALYDELKRAITRPPIPSGDLGQMGSLWDGVSNFLSSPGGQQAVNAVSAIARNAAGRPGPSPAPAPSAAPAANPGITITPAGLNSAAQAGAFGQGVFVQTIP